MTNDPSNMMWDPIDRRIEETIAPFRLQVTAMRNSLKDLLELVDNQQAALNRLSERQPPDETWAQRQILLAEIDREILANPDPAPGEATRKNIGKCALCRHLAAAYGELAPRPTDKPTTSRLTLACWAELRFQPALVVTTCNLFLQMPDAPTNLAEASIGPAPPVIN